MSVFRIQFGLISSPILHWELVCVQLMRKQGECLYGTIVINNINIFCFPHSYYFRTNPPFPLYKICRKILSSPSKYVSTLHLYGFLIKSLNQQTFKMAILLHYLTFTLSYLVVSRSHLNRSWFLITAWDTSIATKCI